MGENIFDRSVLSSEATKLLDVLLDHVNEIGRAQVATSTLQKESGLTQGALVRARTELTQASLLRTEPGFSSSGLRGANVYVLNMTTIEPASMQNSEAESGRIGTQDRDVAGQKESGDVQAASGRHRGERKGFWKRLFGGAQTS